MRNRYVHLIKPGAVEVAEESLPRLKSGQALIKLRASGICGSDLHYFHHGGLGTFKEKLPFRLGHEPAGDVCEVNGIEWLEAGDRVAVEPGSHCGHCHMCHKGLHNLCSGGTFLGAQGHYGAMADYVIVNENQIAKIAPNVSYEQASLFEPLGVAMHAINRVSLAMTESVVIFGAGPIGLSIVNLALVAGCARILVVDKLAYRLRVAERLGATHIFPHTPEAIKEIVDITNGGVDVVFDAAGKKETFDSAFLCAGPSGRVALVGIPTYDFIDYNPHKTRIKEVTLFNCRRSNQTLHKCAEVHSHKLYTTEGIVTHRFSLEDAQKAFETASSYSGGVVKALFSS